MSALVSRVLVALVLLPLVFLVVWAGGWWMVAGAAVVAVVGLHELYVMTRTLRPVLLAGYVGAVAALVGASLGGPEWALAGFLATFPLTFLFKGLAGSRPATVSTASTVLGSAWVGLGLAHLLLVRELPEHGVLAAYTVLLAVFASETASYFVGRLLGRHKLAPRTSPGKTWEGLIGGTIAAILVPFFAFYDEAVLDVPESLVLGAAIAIAAPMGDLFESALKRDAQVKDSGRLLGGHGGMLDRLDSLLFSAVAAYYVFVAFGAG